MRTRPQLPRWPATHQASIAVGLLGLVLLAICLLLNLRDPGLPGGDLDGSWMVANEFAASHHLAFGRDVVFTYGPYHYLATHLFDPATFPLVLVYAVLSTVAIFWFALAHRSVTAIAAIAFCTLVLQTSGDAFNLVTLFAAFLICLERRSPWSLAVAALCAPLALAKYSFALVILPLMALADAERVAERRLPPFTATFVAAALACELAAGQPLSAVGDLVRNELQIILGYGGAMQITGPQAELALAAILAASTAAFGGVLAWRVRAGADAGGGRDWRPAAAAIGLGWTLFILFKAGFVRQDSHTMIFHQAAPAAFAVANAYLARPGWLSPRAKLACALVFLLLIGNSLYWYSDLQPRSASAHRRVGVELRELVKEVPPRLRVGVAWVEGKRFGEMRRARAQALAALRREFPPTVVGRVDIVPWDLSPLIGSGLDYDPRPVIQSYSSYTPALQALDLAHFEGPKAPDTLLLRMQDIDGRLPTLALGPSLPVIGQRYDAVGVDDLGLILRRRALSRPVTTRALGRAVVDLDRWSPVPGRPGSLLMARIRVQRSLAGRLVGFLYREPLMGIELRTADGARATYRFTPGMAELGVAISPLPGSWDDGAQPLLDPQSALSSQPVAAFRLTGKPWAFGKVSVAYQEISLAPGFASGLPATAEGSPKPAAAR